MLRPEYEKNADMINGQMKIKILGFSNINYFCKYRKYVEKDIYYAYYALQQALNREPFYIMYKFDEAQNQMLPLDYIGYNEDGYFHVFNKKEMKLIWKQVKKTMEFKILSKTARIQ